MPAFKAPILDEAYMENRRRWEAFRRQSEYRFGFARPEPKDEKEQARDAYLAGEITAEAFEIRLNTAFGLPAYQSIRAS